MFGTFNSAEYSVCCSAILFIIDHSICGVVLISSLHVHQIASNMAN